MALTVQDAVVEEGSLMQWEEMRQSYAEQWLLIAYQALDAQLNVLEGEAIAACYRSLTLAAKRLPHCTPQRCCIR